MSAAANHHAQPEIEQGVLDICGVKFQAERWVESDGAHVVRSLEFDIAGYGDSWVEAVESFFDAADDLVSHLIEVVTGEDGTEYERETVKELGPRIVAAYQGWNAMLENRIEELQKRRVNLGRRDRQHLPDPWHSTSTPRRHSKQLSPA
ncbi:MAG TPA: hypothetical protein VHC67_10150 [Gaiellaceae bacterium]|nr:hypothetical protein [Gaiellaceae bacterium]